MSLPEPASEDLTAYAMGELDPARSARMRRHLASSPEARAEYERIQQTIQMLRQAPRPARRSLHPRQRETILAMIQQEHVVKFRQPAARQGVIWRPLKIAAAAALAFGAFLLGKNSVNQLGMVSLPAWTTLTPGPNGESLLPADDAPQAVPSPGFADHSPHADVAMWSNFSAVRGENPLLVIPSLPYQTTLTLPTLPEVAPAPAPAVAATPPMPAADTQASPARPVIPLATPEGFQSTSTHPETHLVFQPRLARRQPVEFAGLVLASPAPVDARPAPKSKSVKPEAQPPLVVRSWKAEIASCPWDDSRRLMRVVVQIPADQAAIEFNDADYQLAARFDPFHVQAYRLVAEKHMRPSSGGTQATRFAWYEIIPTRNFQASPDKAVTIGSLDIVQPRQGSAAVQDSSIKLVDRGLAWKDAREDYVFETAMVGFGMLLRGLPNTSQLDYKLVLDVAEKSRDEDPKGERSKFIQVVKQAQRASGL